MVMNHYMLKEIIEQPDIIRKLTSEYLQDTEVVFPNLKLGHDYYARVTRIIIQAAGTSWHAGLIGKFF